MEEVNIQWKFYFITWHLYLRSYTKLFAIIAIWVGAGNFNEPVGIYLFKALVFVRTD